MEFSCTDLKEIFQCCIESQKAEQKCVFDEFLQTKKSYSLFLRYTKAENLVPCFLCAMAYKEMPFERKVKFGKFNFTIVYPLEAEQNIKLQRKSSSYF